MKIHKIVSILTLSTALLPPALLADEPGNWSFEIAPYVWVASIGAEASVPQGPSTTPGLQGAAAGNFSTVQDFDTSITGGLMIAAQAKYRSVGLVVDFNWLRLDTESLHPGTLYSGVNLQSDFIYSTAALSYELPFKGKFHAEVEAGARIWSVSTDLDVQGGALPGFLSSRTDTWVSGLIGTSLRFDLTKHWVLLGRATVGGFTKSSIQWDLFGGVGYQFSDWCMASLGYRYLHEDYNKDNFTFNAKAQGPVLGVAFRF
jgi:opacity protein-like surface antigen